MNLQYECGGVFPLLVFLKMPIRKSREKRKNGCKKKTRLHNKSQTYLHFFEDVHLS